MRINSTLNIQTCSFSTENTMNTIIISGESLECQYILFEQNGWKYPGGHRHMSGGPGIQVPPLKQG